MRVDAGLAQGFSQASVERLRALGDTGRAEDIDHRGSLRPRRGDVTERQIQHDPQQLPELGRRALLDRVVARVVRPWSELVDHNFTRALLQKHFDS